MGKNLKETDVIRVYDGDAWDYTCQEITLQELKEFLKNSWNLTGGRVWYPPKNEGKEDENIL